ncbi:hypothetical protein [Flavihumibacter petaseus]|uniref:Uncharacterized protein n=1 Tax=Flavihumibacter petaseus NBRC 106054 TaxID=1220578 RepID=A0A0E9MXU2_9BACT|nr:hypothetical protein [Flavihumibacter petaseus]GAO42333.1 hypothetical protein FPE01S_01_13470 [Flavihumibacter petaseus NBRC 106054]
MAVVKPGSILHGFRGRVGDYVLRRIGNKTIVSAAPKARKGKPTAGQLAYQERFRLANIYAA